VGKRIYLVVSVALLALGAGLFAGWRAQTPDSLSPEQAKSSVETLYVTTLPDLKGNYQSFEQWRGKALIVNFWATWCPPCREEIPQFIKVQEKYRTRGLVFVGVAVDKKDAVLAYAEEIGINYPVLIGDLEAIEITRKAGNRAGTLPFTLIIDRTGKIIATELGGLTQAKLETIIGPLLE